MNSMRKTIHRSITLAAVSAALCLGFNSSSASAQDAEVAQTPEVPAVQEGPQDFQAQDAQQQDFQQTRQAGRRGRGGGQQQQYDPNNPDPTALGGGRGRGGRGGRGQGGTYDPNLDYGPGGGGGGRRGSRVDPVTGEVMVQNTRNRTNAQTYVPDPNADAFTQEYGVVFQHNIFMRNRVWLAPAPPVARVPQPLEATNYLVGLVKEDDGQYRAYIEDTNRRVLQTLAINDGVANGKITDISMNSITYTVGDKSTIVPVGAFLNGAQGGAFSRLSVLADSSRTAYNGFSGGENNNLSVRGGRGQQGGFTGANGNFNGGGGAQFNNVNGGGRGQRGGGGTAFLPQNTAPVPAPPPLPSADGMSIEERMRMRRANEGQPSVAAPQPVVAAPVVEAAPAAPAPIVDPSVGAGLSIEEQMRLRRLQGQ